MSVDDDGADDDHCYDCDHEDQRPMMANRKKTLLSVVQNENVLKIYGWYQMKHRITK